MNLKKKKELSARTLGVGKNRIYFNPEHLTDIKEAITKQDIRDLYSEKIITIKPILGRKKREKRKTKIGFGHIKKKIRNRKQIYVKITRKLRGYLKELRNLKIIPQELYLELRKKVKTREFKSKASLREYLETTKKIKFENKKSSVKKQQIK
jgi:large subunit ribosomal protein L19e